MSKQNPGGRKAGAKPGASGRSSGAKVVGAASRGNGSGRGPLAAGIVVVLALAVVIGGYVYQHQRSAPVAGGVVAAQGVPVSTAGGAILVGAADAPVTLDVFEDAMCPVCAQFESRDGQEVATALEDGSVAVRYHLLNFLNASSASGDYSTRAAAAALAVARDGDGSALPEFHSALFSSDVQPRERGSSDLSNAQLADLAATFGVSQEAQDQISSGALVSEAAGAATASEQALTATGNQVATPTVLDGATKVEINDPSWLSSLTG